MVDSLADNADRVSRRSLSTRRKALFATVVVLAVTGLAELSARALTQSPAESSRFHQMNEIVVLLGTDRSDLMMEPDAERFWKLKSEIYIDEATNQLWPGRVSNSLGFRGPEFEMEKNPDVFRVVCFGDSSTFGIGSRVEDTWPAMLEQQLNARGDGRIYEVINAGVPGYTSWQGLKHMQQELPRLQADLVFASYANNDFWRWDGRTDREQEKRLEQNRSLAVLRRSRLFALTESWMGSWQAEPEQEWAWQASMNYFKPEEDWTPRVPLNEFRENMNAMADLCERHNAELILVAWPDKPQASGQAGVRLEYQKVLWEIAMQRGLSVSDVVSNFQKNRAWSVNTYIPNDIVHVDRKGNGLAAESAEKAVPRYRISSGAMQAN